MIFVRHSNCPGRSSPSGTSAEGTRSVPATFAAVNGYRGCEPTPRPLVAALHPGGWAGFSGEVPEEFDEPDEWGYCERVARKNRTGYRIRTCAQKRMKRPGKKETVAALGLSCVLADPARPRATSARAGAEKCNSNADNGLRRGCGFFVRPKHARKKSPRATSQWSHRTIECTSRVHTNPKRERGPFGELPSLALRVSVRQTSRQRGSKGGQTPSIHFTRSVPTPSLGPHLREAPLRPPPARGRSRASPLLPAARGCKSLRDRQLRF